MPIQRLPKPFPTDLTLSSWACHVLSHEGAVDTMTGASSAQVRAEHLEWGFKVTFERFSTMKARKRVAENLSEKLVGWFDEIRFALTRTGLVRLLVGRIASANHRQSIPSENPARAIRVPVFHRSRVAVA